MYLHNNYNNPDDDDDDDENVTRLIVKPSAKYVQPPIYRSIYRKSVEEEATLNKSGHKTLGVMKVALNGPQQFLRKKSGIRQQPPKINHENNRRSKSENKLPARKSMRLPKISYKPQETSNNSRKYERNFSKLSALNVKKEQTQGTSNSPQSTTKLTNSAKRQLHTTQRIKIPVNKKLHAKYLDNSAPAKNAEKSRSTTKFIKSSGKNSLKESLSILENKEDVTEPIKILKEKPNGRYIPDDEREQLIYGMKKKWDEMMRQFQALPFLTDTPPKAKRKAKMEADLKQLEKDIEEIERHSRIYVYDDDENDGGNIKND